ncbi:MAG: 6-bladed beta-propeller [Candidatus Saccharicenans sp.]|nr:6-bladed beta-propeller [Candidatus Saccharicenans sp.]MDH7575954.1 6-bladed beta-propeller [Candidatus Saccharicenans sp.]
MKFIPELTIGQESGDENFMFGHISYIDVDPDGNIYVTDSKNRQVRIFDRDGRFIRKIIVPEGQGPQELNQISGIAVTPSGLLFINGDRKMIVYDGQGNYLRTFKVDFHVSCIRSAGSEEVIGIGPHEEKILHVFDSEGRLLSSFGEVFEVPKDFEPMKMMPMFGAPLLFSASKDGRVFVLNPHRYQVLVFRNKKLEATVAGSSELYEPLARMGRGFVSTAAIILPAGKSLLVYFEYFKNQERVADLFLGEKQVGSLKLPGELKAIDYQGKLYMVIPGEFPRVTRYSVSE